MPSRLAAFAALLMVTVTTSIAWAHGISAENQAAMAIGGPLDYIWLGAEHMVTGYDHLLFLFGVIFFLSNFRDIVKFITAFTLGHCITLLGATLFEITANAYLIDAVIALSVVYKGFENLGGFKKLLNKPAPNLLAMVFLFGLIHGFGLSTRLQQLPLGHDDLILKILSFNVGVELGQVAALSIMLSLFVLARRIKGFDLVANAANAVLVAAGLGLFWWQLTGYVNEQSALAEERDAAHDAAHESGAEHGHGEPNEHDRAHESGAEHDHGEPSEHERAHESGEAHEH